MVNLEGKNEIGRFRQVAENIASRITLQENVAGIIFLGGLTRGFVDEHSDVDITVFVTQKNEQLISKIKEARDEEQTRTNVDVDLEIHLLEEFRKRRLSEGFKWDLSHAEIVSDSRNAIRRLLEKKLSVPESFWLRRIVVCSEYLKWYCCPIKENEKTIAETWVDRGDLVSAYYCASYGLDLLVSVLYALNEVFLPPPKWRLFYSYTLKLLPRDYFGSIREFVITNSFSALGLKRKLKVLADLWHDILPEIQSKTGLTSALINKYYVDRVLHQN